MDDERDDLGTLLDGAFLPPSREAPVEGVLRRARARRARRRVVLACAAVTLLAGIGAVAATSGGARVNFAADGGGHAGVPAEVPPAGLVAFDPFQPADRPPPPVLALLELPACADSGQLAAWTEEVLRPFDAGERAPLRSAQLDDVIDAAPLLRDASPAPACATALAGEDVRAWQLEDADGVVLGRGAAVPASGVVKEIWDRYGALGGINFGAVPLASGQQVSGVLRDGLLELELHGGGAQPEHLYVVEVLDAGTAPPGGETQGAAHALVARLTSSRLTDPEFAWPMPLPRALPSGFARCAGPALTEASLTSRTELCDDEGATIVVTETNKGSNVVPEPSVTTAVREEGDRLVLSIDTAVNAVEVDVPGVLGRSTLEAMARTIPLTDDRVWSPSDGRPGELLDDYDADWLRATLTAAGATEIAVEQGFFLCLGWGDDEECEPKEPGRHHRITLTDAEGHKLEGGTGLILPGQGREDQAPGAVTRILTVGRTDVLVRQADGSASAQCGGVRFHLRPRAPVGEPPDHDSEGPSLDMLAALLRHLRC